MLKAKDMQILFKFNNIINKNEQEKVKIAEILKDHFTVKTALTLGRLKVFFLEQLINETGDKMITWQQLKLLRRNSSKGKVAKWFKTKEKEPSFNTQDSNKDALKIILPKLIEDGRRKDWVLLKTTKEKKREG